MLNGALAATVLHDLQLQITDFSPYKVKDVVPPYPEVICLLSVNIQVAGTAAAATLSSEACVDALRIAPKAYQGVRTVVYKEKKRVSV